MTGEKSHLKCPVILMVSERVKLGFPINPDDVPAVFNLLVALWDVYETAPGSDLTNRVEDLAIPREAANWESDRSLALEVSLDEQNAQKKPGD